MSVCFNEHLNLSLSTLCSSVHRPVEERKTDDQIAFEAMVAKTMEVSRIMGQQVADYRERVPKEETSLSIEQLAWLPPIELTIEWYKGLEKYENIKNQFNQPNLTNDGLIRLISNHLGERLADFEQSFTELIRIENSPDHPRKDFPKKIILLEKCTRILKELLQKLIDVDLNISILTFNIV